MFGAQKRAAHVHRENLIPLVDAYLMGELVDSGDSSVVHQNVRRAKSTDYFLDAGTNLSLIGHIDSNKTRIATRLLDTGRRLFAGRLNDVEHGDTCVFFSEAPSSSFTDTRPSASDNGDLLFKPFHTMSPP